MGAKEESNNREEKGCIREDNTGEQNGCLKERLKKRGIKWKHTVRERKHTNINNVCNEEKKQKK